MTKESNTRPLIPLEYCSPERAARLFCCEVDDILHWASIGAIKLHAKFPDAVYSDGEECLVGEIYLNDSLIEYEKFKEIEYTKDGVVGYKKISYGESGPINIRSNHLAVDQATLRLGHLCVCQSQTVGITVEPYHSLDSGKLIVNLFIKCYCQEREKEMTTGISKQFIPGMKHQKNQK